MEGETYRLNPNAIPTIFPPNNWDKLSQPCKRKQTFSNIREEPAEKVAYIEYPLPNDGTDSATDPLEETQSDDQILNRIIKLESSNHSTENSITKPCEIRLVDVVKAGYIDVDPNERIGGDLNKINLGNKSCYNCVNLEQKLQEAYGTIEIMRKEIDSLKAKVCRVEPPTKRPTKPVTIKIAHITKLRPTMTTKLKPQPEVPMTILKPKMEIIEPIQSSLNVQLIPEINTTPNSEPLQAIKTSPIEPMKVTVVNENNGKICKLCKVLLSTEELKQHLCIKRSSISCKYCQKGFTSTHTFLSHLLAPDHGKRINADRQAKKFLKCDKCQLAYPMAILLECHKEYHSILEQGTNQQPETKKNRKPTIKVKLDIDGSSLEKLYQCGKCNDKFESSQKLNEHMRGLHSEKKILECYICKMRSIQNITYLRNHISNHDVFERCDICKSSLESEDVNIHLCGKENSIQCEYCDENFTSTVKLLAHLNDNHEQKLSYKCDKCPKLLPMIFLKEQHMTQHVDIPRPFICDVCPKAFTTKLNLKSHKYIHNMKKDHLCDECGRGFVTEKLLYNHKHYSSFHSEPKLQCPDCPQRFFTPYKLKKHSSVHQGIIFACSICKRECQSRLSYAKHMKTHDPAEANKKYECKICSKIFHKEKYLKNHYSVHTNERRFKCQFCDASYKYKGDLNKHLRIHLDGKIHRCDKCPEGFYYPEQLQEHLNKHFKEEKEHLVKDLEKPL